MTDENAELRRELAAALSRIERLELKAELARLQRGPQFMPYVIVGPTGNGWAAGYCPAEQWPAISASADVRAVSLGPVSMEEAGNIAAALEMTFNRQAGIEGVRYA